MTRTSPRPVTGRRTRRRVTLAVTAVAVTFVMAACMNADQQTAFDLVNHERAAASVPSLHHDATAQAKAQAWADQLAAGGTLAHSSLSEGMDDQWSRLAENVGHGSSIEQVHARFMDSGQHRSTILDASLTHLGAGIAHDHGRTFVVLVFVQR